MTIEMIQVHGATKPRADANVALIHITSPVSDRASVEAHQGQDGFYSVTTIRAKHTGEMVAVLHDQLTSLDFDSAIDLVVAIYSDSSSVSAYDAAYIAQIDMPHARMETPDGETIAGFKTKVSPLIESDFESGAIAALDGQDAAINPHPLGTEAHDKWACGFQSSHSEGAQLAA